jgi:hypothetical protein
MPIGYFACFPMIPGGYPTDIMEIFCFRGCFKFGNAHGAGHSPNKHPSAALYILYGSECAG